MSQYEIEMFRKTFVDGNTGQWPPSHRNSRRVFFSLKSRLNNLFSRFVTYVGYFLEGASIKVTFRTISSAFHSRAAKKKAWSAKKRLRYLFLWGRGTN